MGYSILLTWITGGKHNNYENWSKKVGEKK